MLSHIALFTTYNHSVKPWPDDGNIVAAKCCLLAPNLTIFKLELTTHMLQHVTTKWPTV